MLRTKDSAQPIDPEGSIRMTLTLDSGPMMRQNMVVALVAEVTDGEQDAGKRNLQVMPPVTYTSKQTLSSSFSIENRFPHTQ